MVLFGFGVLQFVRGSGQSTRGGVAGAALFMTMGLLSVATATVFPQDAWGSPPTFRGQMHQNLSGVVGLVSMLSMVLIGIWLNRTKLFPGFRTYSFVTVSISLLSAAWFAANWGSPIMGLTERITILVGFQWTFVLALWMFSRHDERLPIILETERLTLRYQQPSDVEPLVDLWADPEVTRYMGGPRDREWLESALEETACDPYAERYDLWPLIEKETGQVVGDCGLLDKEVEGRTEIELIYVLASSAWGRGYATEIGQALKAYAFEEMGLGRLIALIEPENTASARVAEKVGLRLEKEVVRPGGEVRKVYAVER